MMLKAFNFDDFENDFSYYKKHVLCTFKIRLYILNKIFGRMNLTNI